MLVMNGYEATKIEEILIRIYQLFEFLVHTFTRRWVVFRNTWNELFFDEPIDMYNKLFWNTFKHILKNWDKR